MTRFVVREFPFLPDEFYVVDSLGDVDEAVEVAGSRKVAQERAATLNAETVESKHGDSPSDRAGAQDKTPPGLGC